MSFILVTLLVLLPPLFQLDKSMVSRLEQPLNICSMVVTFEVLNMLTSMLVSFEQARNMFFSDVRLDVSKPNPKSMLPSSLQPSHSDTMPSPVT